MHVTRLGSGHESVVTAAAELFDHPPEPTYVERFLAASGHHLLVAADQGRTLGFVTGVEMTHPDKGTEMFLYELGVAEHARGRGVGAALVQALVDLARSRGCYGMWVLTEADNEAALRTYTSAGASPAGRPVMLEWRLSPESG